MADRDVELRAVRTQDHAAYARADGDRLDDAVARRVDDAETAGALIRDEDQRGEKRGDHPRILLSLECGPIRKTDAQVLRVVMLVCLGDGVIRVDGDWIRV